MQTCHLSFLTLLSLQEPNKFGQQDEETLDVTLLKIIFIYMYLRNRFYYDRAHLKLKALQLTKW